MMKTEERQALMAALATLVKAYVDAAMRDMLAAIEKKIDTIPRPERGEPGPSGPAGRDGKDGARGKDGRDGERGPQGAPGKDGERGAQGPQGKDGRDAPQIDILPAIDPKKEYPRGTFACWDGGLVRAYRETIPVTREPDLLKGGWDVIVRGLASMSVGMSADGRELAVGVQETGNEAVTHRMRLPVMVYRGIWKTGEPYHQGDVVTYGGSAWCSLVDNPKSVPGTNEAEWRLMVKEGRKGKDGKDGERGPQGPPGRPGMDKL